MPVSRTRCSPGTRSGAHASRRRITQAIGLFATLQALPGIVSAQEAPERAVQLQVAPTNSAAVFQPKAGEAIELSLEQVISAALEHNLSLAVQRFERSRTLLDLNAALGIYDFNLTTDLSLTSNTRPRSSALEQVEGNITSDQENLNFGLTRLFPWGGAAEVTFNNRRSSTSDANVLLDPQYSSNLNLGFEQPLLRNFGKEVTERDIFVSRTNAAINRESFRVEVESIVQQVSDRYWDLVEARQQLSVALESLKLAKELHEMNRIQVEVGTKAPLEMVQSEVGVATREEEIIRRQAAVEDAEDQIRRLTNLAPEAWGRPLIPLTEPGIPFVPIEVQSFVDRAQTQRADVLRSVLTIERAKLDARVAKNRTLPQLNVTAGYGASGLAGRLTITDPTTGEVLTIDDDWADSISQITDRSFDGWQVALKFAYPLENRTAKARLAQADLQVSQAELELRDLKDQIMLEVRKAARGVETAAKTIESARVSSKLARKNLEAEQKRYENGLSTSFQVLEIQEDLSQALSREVSSVIAYRKQLVNLYQVTGELLEKSRVRLTE